MIERKGAKQRRLERRLARKVFKTAAKQPPEVFVAYLKGLVSGAELRQVTDLALLNMPQMDIFGNQVSGLQARLPAGDEAERDVGAPATVFH